MRSYLESAREGKNHFWRYGIVIGAVVFGMLLFQALLFGVAALIEGTFDIFSFSPVTLLWVSMLPFGVALVCVILGVRFIHQRSIWSLVSPQGRFRWRLFLLSAGLWFGLSGVSDIVLSIFQPGNYRFNPDLAGIFIYFLIAFVLLIIQVSAEEFFFRGYIMQMVGRKTMLFLIPLVTQAVLFGLLHGANTEVTTYGFWTTMPFYIGMGLLLGFLTLHTNGLEAALGMHFANNIYATSIVTFAGSSIQSPALFMIQTYQPITSLVVFFLLAFIFLAGFLAINPEKGRLRSSASVESSSME